MSVVIQLGPANHTAWQGVLTPRQAEVVEMVAQGWSTSEIAKELCVVDQSIKYHVANVYDRLGVAYERGIHQRVILARWWWTNIERNSKSDPNLESKMHGQQSLNNFYQSVKFHSPRQAALMSDDIIQVALNALSDDKTQGQHAADRLRKKAKDLPIALQRVLEGSLTEMGYS